MAAVTTTAGGAALGRASGGERSAKSLVFLVALWLSLFFAFAFLLTLIMTTLIDGLPRLDATLFTNYTSSFAERAGARAAVLGSLMVVGFCALLAVPLGVAAAIHLEEFADRHRWYNRLFELNIANLAAVPSIIYGMLALGFLAVLGVANKNIVIGGSLALALLILPVIIITAREALRAVPAEIKEGSLALGATEWQTVWRQTLPAALPGIATGTIIALSRAIGEAAPLLLLGGLVFVTYDPNGLLSGFTTLPIQIFNWVQLPQADFKTVASAAIIVLLAILLAMNGLAIYIRNRFQRRW
ncbi:phosphate ABC transporter permease PstA [Actinopolymorpha sp. B17G11]|uniref:phosphate ABC transporter permease PstA n=1 Tax=unclassified Actinopolymorpha TaxID=2627063 RepID=UPI0032D8B49D